MSHYILKDGEPILEPDLLTWAKNFEIEDRRVALTEFGGVRISTVFLGLDHSFGDGAPVLFETMIFGGAEDGYQERYHTLEESMLGHERAVQIAKRANNVWSRLKLGVGKIVAFVSSRFSGSH